MRQRTFFLTSVGWRTFSVGQIHMSKAKIAYWNCPLVSFETCFGLLWAWNWQNIFGDPNMRRRTFYLTSFGWRTVFVEQIDKSKAQKHIESAHKCPLRPPEDLCGHETDKSSLEIQSCGRDLFS